MSSYFRPIIINAFPEHTWGPLSRGVLQGIALADDLLKRERWLNWPVGRDQRGDLRRAGVMWALKEACNSKSLPFSCEDRCNTCKNCHHIEIRSQNVYLHVNRTDGSRAMPRDTKLRNDERLSNQYDLFRPASLTTDLSEIRMWYAWLTFNADHAGQLTHLAIGLLEHQGDEWLDIVPLRFANLNNSSNVDEEPLPPGPDQLMKFKDEIRKMPEGPVEDEGADAG